MGILDCFSCMLSGHILYGYFVLLMVNWKRKFSGKEYFLCSQSFNSKLMFSKSVSVCVFKWSVSVSLNALEVRMSISLFNLYPPTAHECGLVW